MSDPLADFLADHKAQAAAQADDPLAQFLAQQDAPGFPRSTDTPARKAARIVRENEAGYTAPPTRGEKWATALAGPPVVPDPYHPSARIMAWLRHMTPEQYLKWNNDYKRDNPQEFAAQAGLDSLQSDIGGIIAGAGAAGIVARAPSLIAAMPRALPYLADAVGGIAGSATANVGSGAPNTVEGTARTAVLSAGLGKFLRGGTRGSGQVADKIKYSPTAMADDIQVLEKHGYTPSPMPGRPVRNMRAAGTHADYGPNLPRSPSEAQGLPATSAGRGESGNLSARRFDMELDTADRLSQERFDRRAWRQDQPPGARVPGYAPRPYPGGEGPTDISTEPLLPAIDAELADPAAEIMPGVRGQMSNLRTALTRDMEPTVDIHHRPAEGYVPHPSTLRPPSPPPPPPRPPVVARPPTPAPPAAHPMPPMEAHPMPPMPPEDFSEGARAVGEPPLTAVEQFYEPDTLVEHRPTLAEPPPAAPEFPWTPSRANPSGVGPPSVVEPSVPEYEAYESVGRASAPPAAPPGPPAPPAGFRPMSDEWYARRAAAAEAEAARNYTGPPAAGASPEALARLEALRARVAGITSNSAEFARDAANFDPGGAAATRPPPPSFESASRRSVGASSPPGRMETLPRRPPAEGPPPAGPGSGLPVLEDLPSAVDPHSATTIAEPPLPAAPTPPGPPPPEEPFPHEARASAGGTALDLAPHEALARHLGIRRRPGATMRVGPPPGPPATAPLTVSTPRFTPDSGALPASSFTTKVVDPRPRADGLGFRPELADPTYKDARIPYPAVDHPETMARPRTASAGDVRHGVEEGAADIPLEPERVGIGDVRGRVTTPAEPGLEALGPGHPPQHVRTVSDLNKIRQRLEEVGKVGEKEGYTLGEQPSVRMAGKIREHIRENAPKTAANNLRRHVLRTQNENTRALMKDAGDIPESFGMQLAGQGEEGSKAVGNRAPRLREFAETFPTSKRMTAADVQRLMDQPRLLHAEERLKLKKLPRIGGGGTDALNLAAPVIARGGYPFLRGVQDSKAERLAYVPNMLRALQRAQERQRQQEQQP